MFPGADGIANATVEQYTQVDYDGKPLPRLPPVWKGRDADPAFPTNLPNRPFRIDAPPISMPLSVPTRDLVHKFYRHQEQINGGRNDRFAEVSDAGGLVMGYYDGSTLPMWQWAKEYVLADRFFMGAFGDSYINHAWFVCACTPRDPNIPAARRAQLDDRGWLKRRPDSPPTALAGPAQFIPGEFTPDGTPSATHSRHGSLRACRRRPEAIRVTRTRRSSRCRRRRPRRSPIRCRPRASLGVVCGRLERCAARRHAGARSQTQGDL